MQDIADGNPNQPQPNPDPNAAGTGSLTDPAGDPPGSSTAEQANPSNEAEADRGLMAATDGSQPPVVAVADGDPRQRESYHLPDAGSNVQQATQSTVTGAGDASGRPDAVHGSGRVEFDSGRFADYESFEEAMEAYAREAKQRGEEPTKWNLWQKHANEIAAHYYETDEHRGDTGYFARVRANTKLKVYGEPHKSSRKPARGAVPAREGTGPPLERSRTASGPKASEPVRREVRATLAPVSKRAAAPREVAAAPATTRLTPLPEEGPEVHSSDDYEPPQPEELPPELLAALELTHGSSSDAIEMHFQDSLDIASEGSEIRELNADLLASLQEYNVSPVGRRYAESLEIARKQFCSDYSRDVRADGVLLTAWASQQLGDDKYRQGFLVIQAYARTHALCLLAGFNPVNVREQLEVVHQRIAQERVAKEKEMAQSATQFAALGACLLYTSPSPRD